MHKLEIPEAIRTMVEGRLGKAHAYDRIDPRCTALIVVDMQNYFVAPGAPASSDEAPRIAPGINRLAAALRDRGGQIYWIVTEALPGDANDWLNLYELLGAGRREVRLAELDRESEGFALWPGMDVRPGDETVTKLRYSAFIQDSSDIEARLRAAGVDTVLIAGVATNVCCEATGRDAMMRGFRTIMVHDALATFDDAQHNAALATFYMQFGDVQSIDEVVAHMVGG
jgi:ureidoacrylate peracid hydrolase